MQHGHMGFDTKVIHAGNVKDKQYGSLTTPIYQTSTFIFDNCAQGGNRFALKEDGFIYTRIGNPTTAVLESRMATLEGAQACVAFSSGIGAITAVMWTLCSAGSHIVADLTLYGGTYEYFEHGLKRFGIEVDFVDLADIRNLRAALKENTVAVYLESPANPNMKILDLAAIASEAHKYNPQIKVICDNTFATPYLQRPLELGLDVVVHSATKYLNGHGDVIAGFALGDAEFMTQVRVIGLRDLNGATIGPFEAFLVTRGLKTLPLRMDRHCQNAIAVADYLKGHAKVAKIYFPGLPDHPGHEIAKRQMSKFGAMIAFEVTGGREAAAKLLDSLELCALAVSLGDAETLIEHPASMTHSTYTTDELAFAGIPEGLVRISVGLETVEDIIADLEQGFAKI